MSIFKIAKGVFKVAKKVLKRKPKANRKGFLGGIFKKKNKHKNDPELPAVGETSDPEHYKTLPEVTVAAAAAASGTASPPDTTEKKTVWDVASQFLTGNQYANENDKPQFDLSKRFKLPPIELDHEVSDKQGGISKILIGLGVMVVAVLVFLGLKSSNKKAKK